MAHKPDPARQAISSGPQPFFVMTEIHQQPCQMYLIFWWGPCLFLFLMVTAIESAVKCITFRRRRFFWTAPLNRLDNASHSGGDLFLVR